MAQIDLNADVGEGMELDGALLRVVTSANIACGAHAGDDATMHQTLLAARRAQVAVGAHPGWPDRGNFGRKAMQEPPEVVRTLLLAQIAALMTQAERLGVAVRYVKLHGALANQAADDAALAQVVADVMRSTQLGWLVMAQTAMQRAADVAGVVSRTEAFADRTYTARGLLTPRSAPNAVLQDPEQIAARALEMVTRQALPLEAGVWLPARIDSLCVHGDTPHALAIAQAVRARLEAAQWQVQALTWDVSGTVCAV